MTKPTRILILGGGFAGINAMLTLEKQFAHDPSVEILLVSDENFWLFTPLLSEVAIGAVDPRHILIPIRDLCKKTEFHRATVTSIDLAHQTVDVLYNNVTTCPDSLSYDHLVLALGSVSNVKLVPGVEAHAFNFKSVGDALKLRNHILEMFERADTALDPGEKQAMLTFCVIGGGYSGVEIAAGIEDLARRIEPLYPTISRNDIRVLVIEAQERILTTLPVDLADYAHTTLEEMGVEVLLQTRVQEVLPTSIQLQDSQAVPSHTAVWTTGIMTPPILQSLPVAKDAKGRPRSTPALHFEGYPNVWGIGDNILTPLPGEPDRFYPATAQVAIRQGPHLAQNIARVLYGRSPVPFRYKQKGEMVVLGERSAVAIISGRKLRGFPAWFLWRLFYLSRLPRWKKKFRVATDWFLNLFGPMETTQIKIEPSFIRPEGRPSETSSQISPSQAKPSS